MERKTYLRKEKFAIFLVYFLHIMGVFWYSTELLGNWINQIAGAFIILLGLFTSYYYIVSVKESTYKKVQKIAIIAILGFLLETIGWKTGMPYGNFHYSNLLQPQLFGTPIPIAMAWVSVVLSSSFLSILILKKAKGNLGWFNSGWEQNKIVYVLLAAILSVLLDIFMEPVAIKLGWWTWSSGNPPLENYLTWFVASALFSLLFLNSILKLELKEIAFRVLPHVYFSQLIYFIILRIIL